MISAINIKKITASLGITLLLTLFLTPVFTHGQLNPADPPTNREGTGITYECKDGNCTFDDAVAAVKRLTDWGAKFAIGFSIIIIAYAGYLYMISGGKSKERTEANTMLQKAAIGIVLVLAAWLIVDLILRGLGVQGIQFF